MESTVGIGNSFLAALFFQIDTGVEPEVIERLKSQGYLNLFKAFGRHDLIAFSDVTNFEDKKLYTSCEGVRGFKPLIAYNFILPNYKSPDISLWADEPLLGFTFLELDKFFYSGEQHDLDVSRVCQNVIYKLLEASKSQGAEIAIYGGYGRSELYMAVKSNCLDDIWGMIKVCRELVARECIDGYSGDEKPVSCLPVFMNTRTIISVSNDCIQYGDKVTVSRVEGDSRAVISISCPPGFESYVHMHLVPELNGNVASCYRQHGDEDMCVILNDSISTASLISAILNFRIEWGAKCEAQISTRTALISPIAPSAEQKLSSYVITPDLEKIVIPQGLEQKDSRLATRINHLVNTIYCYCRNKSYEIIVRGVDVYIEYIGQVLEEYLEGRPLSEHKLLRAVEIAEVGLAQRIDSQFESILYNHELPLPFGDGFFSSLVSLELVINYIFHKWSSVTPDYSGREFASGFPTFNDSSGFRITWGETINLPLVALYDPCDSRGSWLTLTHEISHAIFTRLNIGDTCEAELSRIRDEWLVDRSYHLSYDDVYEEQVFELFAQWYDYYHFFEEDRELYLRHAWASWAHLKSIENNFIHYYFRSFYIYALESIRAVPVEERLNADKYMANMRVIFQAHSNYLATILPPNLRAMVVSVNVKMPEIVYLNKAYMELLSIFERYISDEFRELINSKYKLLDAHVKYIMNGRVVQSKIDNIYILIKEVISKLHDKRDARAATALILTIICNNTFYTPG